MSFGDCKGGLLLNWPDEQELLVLLEESFSTCHFPHSQVKGPTILVVMFVEGVWLRVLRASSTDIDAGLVEHDQAELSLSYRL